MDFGEVELGVSSSATTSLAAAETTDQEKLYGSVILKQEISGTNAEGDLRGLKVAKTAAWDDFSASKAMQRSFLLRANATGYSNFDRHGVQMLSFSSPDSQTVAFPFYPPSSNACTRNAAYGSGGMNKGSMQGSRGPFTPSQWMELEHQALIYKYIDANVPIPSCLLTPIRKAVDSAGFSSFLGLRPSAHGWSAFHLGFSNSTDPEPGRCRRTDGKKWRCSKDALPDHKYCERHMNRGRHRSRKPVEGQSGHSVSGTTASTKVKLMPPVASSTSAAGIPGCGASISLGLTSSQQLDYMQSGVASQCSASGPGNRSFLEKENLGGSGTYQDITGLSMISPSASLKGNQDSKPKQQDDFDESSRGEFGQVCSDSLLNPFNKSSSLASYVTSKDQQKMESKSQNSLRQFFVDWPASQSERPSWPDIEMHSARTQLSISIPMTASDFLSSTSSPTNEKAVSPMPRHSGDLEATQMRSHIGTLPTERGRPVTWESSVGGPLGEVLHSTTGEGKASSALNLMTEGWDGGGGPCLASSPTGVLQKAAFVSLSNSSAGSSPRAENSKAHEGYSLCSSVFVSSLRNL